MAEQGLKLLQEAVKEDVQWVQNNCPSEGLSPRAALLQAVGRREAEARVGGRRDREEGRGFRQWKSILQLRYNMGRLSHHALAACRK